MAKSDLIPRPFTQEELSRYSRQLALPEFGIDGQRRLAASSVLVVGAGGLGSPAAIYLAAAGIGTIGIVEFDQVAQSNLHRQILYSSADVGRRKIDAARERITANNANVAVRCFDARLTSSNALEIMEGFDVVIDASDNFATRYLVNDAAVLAGIPSVYASVHKFEGQLSVFGAQGGPCYRCLFREPPPAGLIPNCAEAGVLGVLPGIMGTLQATEAIKLISGIGEPLVGRLMLFDALSMTFRTIQLRRDERCPSCGSSRSQTLVDYDVVCGEGEEIGTRNAVTSATNNGPSPVYGGARAIQSISPRELAELIERGEDVDVVDVREEYEWNIGRIPGARLVPLGRLAGQLETFGADRETVVYCKTGVRSMHAAEQLASAGVPNVVNLSGGIVRWREEVDPDLPPY